MSRIVQQPDQGPDLGQSLDTSQGFLFLPQVTAVRGSNSIEQIATGTLNILTLVEVVISGNLQFWQLQTGAATSDTQNTVSPLDNPLNHWQRVGGFGVAMMAAARLTTAGAVSLANNVLTVIPFDTVRFNSGEWVVATPTRITAIVDGIYSVSGSVSFSPNSTGQRKLSIRQSGTLEIASEQVVNASASLPTNLTVSTITELLAGDYVELSALQNSGGNLSLLKSTNYSPEFAAVRLSSFDSLSPSGSTPPAPTPIPIGTVPPGNTQITTPLSVTDIGWYRLWTGAYPASGHFDIARGLNIDGQTSDTVIDFTIIAGSPEGIINVSRNAIPTPSSPSIDAVRVYHNATASLAYVDVHLIRAGAWSLTYSSGDTNFLASPFLTTDDNGGLPTLTYYLKSNITGGTGTIDVPQINSGGTKLLIPPSASIPWNAATGTAHRTTFNADAPPTLTELSQHVKAIIDDLIFAGIFQVGIPTTMLYTDMVALATSLVFEGSVANLTDIFRVSAAPDTTVQGIYVPVGTFNGHIFYKVQGWTYEAPGQNSARQCYWSTAWSTWTISNAAGNLYHSGGTEVSPWLVVQWKDQSSVNQTVTTVAPNIPMTYNALTDTHTAEVVTDTGSVTGFAGIYLRGADLNGKRRYYLVGTGSNNKRLEWDGVSQWFLKDDSVIFSNIVAAVTYPDQTPWPGVNVTGVNAVDIMSGVTLSGGIVPFNVYDGIYLPMQGVYNPLATRKLVYRRLDGLYYLVADDSTPCWVITDPSFTPQSISDASLGAFPWQVPWTATGITTQQNKVASPGFNSLAVQPNTNITNNVVGNWHL